MLKQYQKPRVVVHFSEAASVRFIESASLLAFIFTASAIALQLRIWVITSGFYQDH